MARRSWRNFDFLLLGALLALSAYGVVMIYSATINTLGVGNPVERQTLYVLVGFILLLITASLDYRWLEAIQIPFESLTPLALSVSSAGLVVVWQVEQLNSAEALSFAQWAPDIPATLLGVLLVIGVYVVDRKWIRDLDLPLTRSVLFLATAIVAGIAGLFLLRQPDAFPYLIVGGIALFYLLDCLSLRICDILRNPIYAATLAMLGIIFVIGKVSGGSQRWLGAGAVQPSELAKILVIVVLAKFLAEREEDLEKFSTILISLAIIAIPMLLIYLQPDLGTALTMIAIWAAMIWTAGIRLRHLTLLIATGIAALPVIWLNLEDYMRDRVLLLINPQNDPDSYFNVRQALISIGSGGWTGKGLTQGTQSQLHFLRVRHTDFIFSVTAEELGLVGALVMMGLLVLILLRMLRIAGRSQDTFGRLIVAGIAGVVLFQSMVNIGMNLSLMPVTGIPLPFVSYGGSSFLTLIVGMGLVESVAMRRKKLEFD